MYTYWTTPPPARLFWMVYLAFFSNPQCEYWNTIESVANPDPLVRSSGRVHNAALYRSARPDLRIRTGHWMQYNRIEEYRSGNLHSTFRMLINRPKIQNFLIVSFCRQKQDDTQACVHKVPNSNLGRLPAMLTKAPRGIPQCFRVNTFKVFMNVSCQVIKRLNRCYGST